MSSEAPCALCTLVYSHWRPLLDHCVEVHPGTEQAVYAAKWIEQEKAQNARGMIWGGDYIGWVKETPDETGYHLRCRGCEYTYSGSMEEASQIAAVHINRTGHAMLQGVSTTVWNLLAVGVR